MWSSSRREPASGFTLLELLVVLLIVALVTSGLAMPLAAQLNLRRADEARRQLEEAKDALLAFAAAHGRLPCPATAASRGEESFAPGASAADGECSNFHDGFLPGAALGLAPLDPEGFVRDPWGSPRNRLRYAVFGSGLSVNGVANPLTRANGMQMATLSGLGAAPHYLYVCASGEAVTGSGCGPAANQLTRRAAFVVLSAGANATAIPPPGSDEARNLDADAVFVFHEASASFDDLLTWVPVHLVASRLLAAGRLP